MSEAIDYQSDGGDRLQWVDSLRGIAVLGVVLVHCGQAARSSGSLGEFAGAGQYGVQLFFIISAITISLTYSKHVARNGSSFRSNLAWISRRLFRIAPLYYFAAVFYSAEHFILNSKLGDLVSTKPDLFDFSMNIFLVHTWIPSAVNSIVPGGWSIGVEVMFYCMFPLIMLMSDVRGFPLILATAAVLALTLSEMAGRSLSSSFPMIPDQYFYLWFPTQVPVLLTGCAFYHHFIAQDIVVTRPSALIVLAFFVLFTGVGLMLGTWGGVAMNVSPTAFGCGFCCLALLVRSDRCHLISNQFFEAIGDRSYSIYIVHIVIVDVAKVFLRILNIDRSESGGLLLVAIYIPTVALAYLISGWTRRWIESPGIAYGRRISAQIVRRAGAGVGVANG